MYESQVNRVSQLIHDLHEEIDEVRKQNVGLRNANEIYSKQNIDLRKNQDQDDLNRQITELKKENKRLYQACHLNEVIKLRKENVRLVAQLENDEHNVGHLDEMRLTDKINFIIDLEKQHGNSWKWIKEADKKTVNELFEYWTQEENPFEERK